MTQRHRARRRFTVSRDIIDPRDAPHSFGETRVPIAVPRKTSNAAQDGPIRDQLEEGSCTAPTGHGYVQFATGWNGSPEQLYASERMADGSLKTNAGSDGRTLVQTLRKIGICAETLCPYTGSCGPRRRPRRCWPTRRSTSSRPGTGSPRSTSCARRRSGRCSARSASRSRQASRATRSRTTACS